MGAGGTRRTDVAPRALPVLGPLDALVPGHIGVRSGPARARVACGELSGSERNSARVAMGCEDLGGPASLYPMIYAMRRGPLLGREYASLDAWTRQDPPTGALAGGQTQAFTGAIETPFGQVLTRVDGRVVPRSDVWVWEPSPFSGADLLIAPLPVGRRAGWPLAMKGAPVHQSPQKSSSVVWLAPRQRLLWVKDAGAVAEKGDAAGWRQVFDPDDADRSGWLAPDELLRTWNQTPRPEGVAEDEVWVDVDLDEQVLALRRGDDTTFVTLVSTGVVEHETPTGVFSVRDKAVAWDMTSKDDAAEPYDVERVPWVVHYAPRYAIHGAYWHDHYGAPRSHGCINLSVRDAERVFHAVAPALPDGWSRVDQGGALVSTVVRVRAGLEEAPERRAGGAE